MVNFLKKVANWFLGKAEEVEKLDDAIKVAVNQQTKRAFYIGATVGVTVTTVIVRIIG
ncbi:hypothetical protein [Propionispora vibrioides]|uniref:Uncharacterized protein n=1 Tax=Propionispora vibrioides TaxID=112903 RepID=A0A1H8UM12_9FIRM|nr:hypothetical protein [Propionispora vibrioides]SEP04252.1 hypothetical protein SAMN04490178_10939 [Propionispora vibrioides]